ncbi:hypothetical protein [Dapis sp. BLCC M229]
MKRSYRAIATAVSEVMRYTHRGQDARTPIFSPFTLYVICPKYAVTMF